MNCLPLFSLSCSLGVAAAPPRCFRCPTLISSCSRSHWSWGTHQLWNVLPLMIYTRSDTHKKALNIVAAGSEWTRVSEIVFCFLEMRNIFSSPCDDRLWVLGHLRWGALMGVLRWICRRCIQFFWKEKEKTNFSQNKRIHLMPTYTGILLTTFDGSNIHSYIKWQEMNRRRIRRRELQGDVSWLVFLRSVSITAILPRWCQDNTVI